MQKIHMVSRLEKLGFRESFLEGISEEINDLDIARVVAVHKDRFIINNGEKDVPAELVGKLTYAAESPLDLKSMIVVLISMLSGPETKPPVEPAADGSYPVAIPGKTTAF